MNLNYYPCDGTFMISHNIDDTASIKVLRETMPAAKRLLPTF